MRLLIAFIAVPLIEIGLFIQVGGAIGLWPTLAIVLITAIAGTYLVKSQGLATIQQLQGRMQAMQDPTEPLAHGAMILFAGALLLTPGFFTDAVGFLLLIPGIRGAVFGQMAKRFRPNWHRADVDPESGNVTIEGDFEEVPAQDGPSGWTKH